jgi:calcineurin-like phosphoesterase family protein
MSPNKFKNDILNNLKGNIFLIRGNHDKDKYLNIYGDRFIWIKYYHELNYIFEDKEYTFILMHYPISSWNRMYKQSIHLHGHNHKIINYKNITKFNIMNVSVENLNYKPISIEKIIKNFN